MSISEIIKNKKLSVSFEIFPPKQSTKMDTIFASIEELSVLKPDFISVTHSAGGSGSTEGTVEIASLIQNKYNIESVAHLTCITSTKQRIMDISNQLKENNIKNVLALRGDLPKDAGESIKKEYFYAKDLIHDLKRHDFCIGAAAYPEGHIECDNMEESVTHLKEKADAGATFLISQLFFDNDYFYSFMDLAVRKQIDIPVLPGIMPFTSKEQLQRMVFMCGASLPTKIVKILYKYENDSDGLKKAGMEFAAEQCQGLVKNNVKGIHIYTMNQPAIAKTIVSAL